MLQMLRAMNRWELAEACQAAGVPEGSRPEEIVRALSGAWWAAPWGAGEEERVLLLRAAEALNLMPRLAHQRHRLGLVERMIYGALIQQAFLAAPAEQQSALLSAAETHPEIVATPFALPPAPELSPDEQRQFALRHYLGTGTGLRAVTAALGEVPVRPEPLGARPGTGALLTALASAGSEGWSGRVVEWVRARRGPDLAALFHVLRLCWRQRQRRLTELRASRAALQEEEKRLLARLESLAAERAALRRGRPWHLRPSAGAGVALGALAGAAAEVVVTGSVHAAATLAAGAGCLWSLTSAAVSAPAGAGPARQTLLETLRRTRRQRALLDRQIALLEE